MGLATGLLIGGGLLANYFGARTQANAAKDAAGQQVASAEQAKAELRPIYQGNVDRMQPYADLGLSALGQTRSLMGYPSAPIPGPTQTGTVAVPNARTPMSPEQMAQMPRPTMVGPDGQPVGQVGSSLASLGGAPMGGGGGSSYGGGLKTPGPQGGSFQTQGGMVKLQAPDGEVREFPEDQASQFIQRGARRVG